MMKIEPYYIDWIPADKEQPEEEGYYLVTVKKPNGYAVRQDKWLKEDESWQSFYGFVKVIAWAPLPEPYDPMEEQDEGQ